MFRGQAEILKNPTTRSRMSKERTIQNACSFKWKGQQGSLRTNLGTWLVAMRCPCLAGSASRRSYFWLIWRGNKATIVYQGTYRNFWSSHASERKAEGCTKSQIETWKHFSSLLEKLVTDWLTVDGVILRFSCWSAFFKYNECWSRDERKATTVPKISNPNVETLFFG